jgi:hypothetical protein
MSGNSKNTAKRLWENYRCRRHNLKLYMLILKPMKLFAMAAAAHWGTRRSGTVLMAKIAWIAGIVTAILSRKMPSLPPDF